MSEATSHVPEITITTLSVETSKKDVGIEQEYPSEKAAELQKDEIKHQEKKDGRIQFVTHGLQYGCQQAGRKSEQHTSNPGGTETIRRAPALNMYRRVPLNHVIATANAISKKNLPEYSLHSVVVATDREKKVTESTEISKELAGNEVVQAEDHSKPLKKKLLRKEKIPHEREMRRRPMVGLKRISNYVERPSHETVRPADEDKMDALAKLFTGNNHRVRPVQRNPAARGEEDDLVEGDIKHRDGALDAPSGTPDDSKVLELDESIMPGPDTVVREAYADLCFLIRRAQIDQTSHFLHLVNGKDLVSMYDGKIAMSTRKFMGLGHRQEQIRRADVCGSEEYMTPMPTLVGDFLHGISVLHVTRVVLPVPVAIILCDVIESLDELKTLSLGYWRIKNCTQNDRHTLLHRIDDLLTTGTASMNTLKYHSFKEVDEEEILEVIGQRCHRASEPDGLPVYGRQMITNLTLGFRNIRRPYSKRCDYHARAVSAFLRSVEDQSESNILESLELHNMCVGESDAMSVLPTLFPFLKQLKFDNVVLEARMLSNLFSASYQFSYNLEVLHLKLDSTLLSGNKFVDARIEDIILACPNLTEIAFEILGNVSIDFPRALEAIADVRRKITSTSKGAHARPSLKVVAWNPVHGLRDMSVRNLADYNAPLERIAFGLLPASVSERSLVSLIISAGETLRMLDVGLPGRSGDIFLQAVSQYCPNLALLSLRSQSFGFGLSTHAISQFIKDAECNDSLKHVTIRTDFTSNGSSSTHSHVGMMRDYARHLTQHRILLAFARFGIRWPALRSISVSDLYFPLNAYPVEVQRRFQFLLQMLKRKITENAMMEIELEAFYISPDTSSR